MFAIRLSIAVNRVAKVGIEHEKCFRSRFARGRHCRRSDRAMKRKICVYVTEDLVSRLAVAAEHRGASKSGLVGAALDRFLDITGDQDDRPGMDVRLRSGGSVPEKQLRGAAARRCGLYELCGKARARVIHMSRILPRPGMARPRAPRIFSPSKRSDICPELR